ncbi:MAG: acetyl-CoA C-acetyltransferase [Myxococcota bacterium]
MQRVFLVDGRRTPFGKFGGSLRDIRTLDLGAHIVRELVKITGVKPEWIDELFLGTCVPAEVGMVAPVVARQVALKAGLLETMPSLTIDRACCSSLTAVQLAWRTIRCGEAELVMTVGTENLSRVPMAIPQLRWGSRLGHVVIQDSIFELGYEGANPVAVDAGEVAIEEGITREMQDEWAYGSQVKYQAAKKAGKFKEEIVPYPIPQPKGEPKIFEEDEFPKPDTTLEKLAKLKPVYGSPTVTAGNAPGLDTGGVANLIASEKAVEKYGLKPIAEILSVASAVMPPRNLARVPAPAIEFALRKAEKSLEELDLIEINEAFAAMPLVSTKLLAKGNEKTLRRLREITNVNGGAIAIGHPVGASGGRILLTLAKELKRRGGGLGVCSICGGLAQGDAALIKAI